MDYTALDSKLNEMVLTGKAMQALAAELGVKAGVLVHPTRLACTGSTIGPSLYHLMEVLGKDRVLERLDRAMS